MSQALTRAEARTLGAPRGAPEGGPVALYLSQLARGSRRAQAGALRDVARFLGASALDVAWHQVSPAELAAFRSWAAERYAPATVNRQLCAVRGVLRACVTLRLMSRDDCAELASVAKVRGARGLAGRALDAGELDRIFAGLDEHTRIGKRDAAMLGLLWGAGLRRAELVRLDVADVLAEGVRVLGKGNNERIVPLPSTVRARVNRWIWYLTSEHYQSGNGALFPHGLAGGRLTVDGVYVRVRSLAERAGLASLSPHDLRRSYVSDLLDLGADVFTVQALVGHASPTTTTRYDRRPARARAAAVEVLALPPIQIERGEGEPDQEQGSGQAEPSHTT